MAIATPTGYGGYEYEFVNTPPDRCICRICHLPSKDAYMTGPCCQGLTVCKSCLDQWQTRAGNTKCPVCSKEEGGFHKNYPIDREIRSLHIYCTNKKRGCEWQDELNDISNHLGNSKGCRFEEVKCSNECGKMIQRQCLTSHVEIECPCRKVNCQYCHDTGEHQFIEGHHKKECPKLPLPCPNKCEVGSVPREDMEAHRKECPLEMIQCEYYSVGCEVKMARKDKEKHKKEKMEDHLMKTNFKLTNTNNQLATALQRINTMEVLLCLATKAITGPASSIHSVVLKSSLKWDDKLAAIALMSKSGDQCCPVILKMSEYDCKSQSDVEWYSDPFYTCNKGYKMCLNVHPAGHGDGKGTHLSVFLCLMKGPHDDELTWPLRGKFEIQLLNHISNSTHYSKTVNFDDRPSGEVTNRVRNYERVNIGWGYHRLISNKYLHWVNSVFQLLKDECLFFQVSKL